MSNKTIYEDMNLHVYKYPSLNAMFQLLCFMFVINTRNTLVLSDFVRSYQMYKKMVKICVLNKAHCNQKQGWIIEFSNRLRKLWSKRSYLPLQLSHKIYYNVRNTRSLSNTEKPFFVKFISRKLHFYELITIIIQINCYKPTRLFSVCHCITSPNTPLTHHHSNTSCTTIYFYHHHIWLLIAT